MLAGSLLITAPQHRLLCSATEDYACQVRRYTCDELVKVLRAGMGVEHGSSFVSLLFAFDVVFSTQGEKGGHRPHD